MFQRLTGRAKIQALTDVTSAEGPLSGYCLLVFARGREDAQVSLPFLIRELMQSTTFLPLEKHDSHIPKPSLALPLIKLGYGAHLVRVLLPMGLSDSWSSRMQKCFFYTNSLKIYLSALTKL